MLIIKEVTRIKETIKITLSNHETFVISYENYIENPLIINNEITKEQIEKVKNNEKKIQAKKEVYKFLRYKYRSEQEVIDFLNELLNDETMILELVTNIKNHGYIDDYSLAKGIISRSLINLHGKERIKTKLLERKISETLINLTLDEIDDDQYLENLSKQMQKYLKSYQSESFTSLKKKMVGNLLNKGYEYEIVKQALNNLKRDEHKELQAAKKFLNRIVKDKTDLLETTSMIKIKSKLAKKGFKNDIIKMVFEEVNKNDIN